MTLPITHDLRRATALEYANLPIESRGQSLNDVGSFLDHNDNVTDNGITQEYASHIGDDTSERRLDADFEEDFGQEMTNVA